MLQSIAIILLMIIFFQDIKHRAVNWILFPILAVIISILSIQQSNVQIFLQNLAFNFLFIAIQITVLTVFVSIKNKKFTNIFSLHFGLGDLLLFVAISMFFSPFTFILFFTISLILILIIWIFISRILENKTIPLAGLMSVLMSIVLIINIIFPKIQFYENSEIINSLFNLYD